MLQYGGLKAWDAAGKVRTTRFESAGAFVRLTVDERGTQYPVTVDPVASRQAYLKASVHSYPYPATEPERFGSWVRRVEGAAGQECSRCFGSAPAQKINLLRLRNLSPGILLGLMYNSFRESWPAWRWAARRPTRSSVPRLARRRSLAP